MGLVVGSAGGHEHTTNNETIINPTNETNNYNAPPVTFTLHDIAIVLERHGLQDTTITEIIGRLRDIHKDEGVRVFCTLQTHNDVAHILGISSTIQIRAIMQAIAEMRQLITTTSSQPVPAKKSVDNISMRFVRRSADTNDKVCIAVLGDNLVGKTSLIRRLLDQPNALPVSTLAIDCGVRYVQANQKPPTKIIIWDTGKWFSFSFGRFPFSRHQLTIFVFDVCRVDTFQSLAGWTKQWDEYDNKPTGAIAIMIGNKIDKENRQVSTEEAENVATASGMSRYVEVSTTTCEQQIFDDLLLDLVTPFVRRIVQC